MLFDNFCTDLFSLLERDSVPVTENTSLRDELGVDSLQMVNLMTDVSEHFEVPLDHLISNVSRIETVGGLFEVVKEGIS